MAPLPTEISGTHPHITTTSPVFLLLQEPFEAAKVTAENSEVNALRVNSSDDISDMDLCRFIYKTLTIPTPTLVENELKKELETVCEVFPELSDNPRDPAIVPLAYHFTTHTSPSTTHYSTLSITRTTISNVHPQTISCTNITTSNNTSKSANTTLSTTPTSIPTTTTFSIESVTSPKQQSKNFSHIATTKRRPPTLDIFPSRDFRLKCHKEHSSPFTQLQTIRRYCTFVPPFF